MTTKKTTTTTKWPSFDEDSPIEEEEVEEEEEDVDWSTTRDEVEETFARLDTFQEKFLVARDVLKQFRDIAKKKKKDDDKSYEEKKEEKKEQTRLLLEAVDDALDEFDGIYNDIVEDPIFKRHILRLYGPKVRQLERELKRTLEGTYKEDDDDRFNVITPLFLPGKRPK